MSHEKEIFEKLPIPRAMASLAVPTIISQLVIMIYNLADTFFIGRTNDPYKVGAASMAYVLFFLLNAFANLSGIGGGSMASRLLGEGKDHKAKAVNSYSLYLSAVLTLIYIAVCFMFMEPLLMFIGASNNTIRYACDYTLWVIVIGGMPAALSITMSHLLRSVGDGKSAGYGLILGSLSNMALDPVFIFLLFPKGEEIAAAAAATAAANMISFIYYVYKYIKSSGKLQISAHPALIADALPYTWKIIGVGLPSAANTFLACVCIMLMNSMTAGFGDIPLAAVGIVKKLEMLPHNVGTGLCQGMIPLVAYNYASGDRQRMKRAISFTRTSGIIFTLCCIVFFEIFAGPVTLAFIKDAETVRLTVSFLRIMVLATPLTVCNFHACYALQAMGKGKESMILAVCRQGLVNIPMLFIMRQLFGLYGLIWAQFAADAITLIFAVFIFRRALNKE